MMPARNKPMASSDVPTGRRMNGAPMFMTAEGRIPKAEDRNPKSEGRKKAETRSPKALVPTRPQDCDAPEWYSCSASASGTDAVPDQPVACSAFGIRPSFGLRDSAFGFGGVLLP